METINLTVREAAALLGLSISSVYRRARKGTLLFTRESGRITIAIDRPQVMTEATQANGGPSTQKTTLQVPTTRTGGAQRELVITPRGRSGIGFFQLFNWC